MPALVFPIVPCATLVKANFLIAGKATQKTVHAWVWDNGICVPMVFSTDLMTLVRADSQIGFTGLV